MCAERIVALLGRRDEPTDGVADYCSWLGGALRSHGYELETYRVPWAERGWSAALGEFRKAAAAWRGSWVLLQYTNLAWSRRGFPLRAPGVLSIVRDSGARCGIVFHDFAPIGGSRLVDHVRSYSQLRALKSLYAGTDVAIFTIPTDKIAWVPADPQKAIFIPVGANFPEPSPDPAAKAMQEDGREKEDKREKIVAIFSITGGSSTGPEVADIGSAVKRALRAAGPIRLLVVGRGSSDADGALRAEFSGTDTQIEVLGLLPPEDMTKALARADVQLFVRGQISSRRGSAIAGIACGLPLVCYEGPETAWPITEAGIVTAPLGDRDALSAALERVLSDDALRASLAERSRLAQKKYFSWNAIANQFAHALQCAHGHEQSAVRAGAVGQQAIGR